LAIACRLLKKDGLLILSTLNRSVLSHFLSITVAENFGIVPKGAHSWDHFLTPQEINHMADFLGLETGLWKKIQPSGWQRWCLKNFSLETQIPRTVINYIVTLKKKA